MPDPNPGRRKGEESIMKRTFSDVVLFSTNPKYLSEAARAERDRVIAERQARDKAWKAAHPEVCIEVDDA